MISLRSLGTFTLFQIGISFVGAATIHGVVFEDRNANGHLDAGEPGVSGVQISDGSAVVVTDADGRYELAADSGATLFVIKPRGWATAVNAQQLPQYYRRLDAGAATSEAVNFALVRREEPDAFRMLLFTDTQPSSPQDVDFLQRTVVKDQAGARDFAFGVTLGDVVNDRLDLYPAVATAMAKIGVPLYYVNGNHDLNLDARDDRGATAGFEAVFGPSTYAFHYGQVLFVALNNVRYLGGPRYVGGLRDDQFTFLENLLKLEPKDELVVLMTHIPWFFPNPANAPTFRMADRTRLFSLLKDRPHNFWVSGHTHYQRHYFYGAADGWTGAQPLHDYNVAAACGGFWGGAPDAEGIPLSMMWDGTPHGYAILSFDGAEVKTDYRAARRPADYQIGLHAPLVAKPKTGYISFFANVFNGHEGWKVEARLDDREWKPINRVLEWDPSYAKLYLDQDYLTQPLALPRLPDPTICYHLWRGYLPADLSLGAHRLEVRATDPTGRAFAASSEVKIVEPKD
jgi:hypothetical protein